eukprot:scaffold420942_cov52-Attheya_sp.AAC.2
MQSGDLFTDDATRVYSFTLVANFTPNSNSGHTNKTRSDLQMGPSGTSPSLHAERVGIACVTFFMDRETDLTFNKQMDISIPKCVKFLSKENDAVFLTINLINRKVRLAHRPHFYKFGGTRIQPEDLYTVLVGFNYQAAAVMIEISLLIHSALIQPPEDTDADDSEEEGGDATFEKVFFRNLVVLPPFLANTLIDSGSRDLCELIIEAMNTISTFDTRHEEDEDMPDAEDALTHIVQFLWAAAHGLVVRTPFLATKNLAKLTSHPHFTKNA